MFCEAGIYSCSPIIESMSQLLCEFGKQQRKPTACRLQVMVALKDLAAEGKTVIVAIHQPRSSIFALFDDLILLTDGAQVLFTAVHLLQACGYMTPNEDCL